MSSVKDVLLERVRSAVEKLRGLRKPVTVDVFRRIALLEPDRFVVYGYTRRKPLAVFNPGALVIGRDLYIFPRLIFDYYWYVSSIGIAKLDIEELLDGYIPSVIEAKILLYPRTRYENGRGCEDARALLDGDKLVVLYTAVGTRHPDCCIPIPRQGYAEFTWSSLSEIRRDVIKIATDSRAEATDDWKDSAIIARKSTVYTMLTRPMLRDYIACWRCILRIDDLSIPIESLEPILVPEEWEYKVGWSTNAVRLDGDAYLVGWHGVAQEDFSYRNGIAVVDSDGRLLGITNYILSPRDIVELYGDRPYVIFGCGLVRYRELLLWIGGISDHAIAVYIAELDKVLEHVRWVGEGRR